MPDAPFAWRKMIARSLFSASVLGLMLAVIQPARAQTETVLYSFQGGLDGQLPFAALAIGPDGNLYGTTSDGFDYPAHGTVFSVTPTGEKKIVYRFRGRGDGGGPESDLVFDPQGNIYGTTPGGGTYRDGLVFKITPSGTARETVIYTFHPRPDGRNPYPYVIRDDAGNIYGVTWWGGAYGRGTVFQISPDGVETVLHNFLDTPDGSWPYASVVLDSKGRLFGTTKIGGTYGLGTIYELEPGIKKDRVLYSFSGKADGGYPLARLIFDADGNLYGTTSIGGNCCGTVFQLSPAGALTTSYTFTGGLDGGIPSAAVVRDEEGNIYGTTSAGGTRGLGTVFKIDSNGNESVLHSFAGAPHDGEKPYAGLVRDAHGNLYGTTYVGGTRNLGTVYKITIP